MARIEDEERMQHLKQKETYSLKRISKVLLHQKRVSLYVVIIDLCLVV